MPEVPEGYARKNMIHINGNSVCAVDVETTGLTPGFHEIIQLAIIPCNSRLERMKDVPSLDLYIRPDNPVRITNEALEKVGAKKWADVLTQGIPSEKAIDMVEDWFRRKLNPPAQKRIEPLAHNWLFDQAMLKEWLGWRTFDMMFSARYRCTLSYASFMNDQADFAGEEIPFKDKLTLGKLCARTGIEYETVLAHDAFYDAEKTREVYRKMVISRKFHDPQ